ncbi:MAG: HAMP domain-containing histidine kinase [Coprobacillus sp.]|nr:HAMP domain-containing histidine kinase [Coprobacillus sp.]
MKRIFKITLFKKIFIIIFLGLLCVEGFHVYLDFQETARSVAESYMTDLTIDKLLELNYQLTNKYKEVEDSQFINLVKNTFQESPGYNAVVNTKNEIVYDDFLSYETNQYILLTNKKDAEDVEMIQLDQLYNHQIQQLNKYIRQSYQEDNCKKFTVYLSKSQDKITYLKINQLELINIESHLIKEYSLNEYISEELNYNHALSTGDAYLLDYEDIKQKSRKIIKKQLKSHNHGYSGKVNADYYLDGNNLYIISAIYDQYPKQTNQTVGLIKIDYVYHSEGIFMDIFETTILAKQKVYILAFMMTLFISIIISYMLTRRIKKIDQSTQQITNNNFNIKLNEKPNDELGTLSKNINIMSQQLKSTIEQLNQEIAKVKELESLRKDFVNQFTHEMKTPLGIINGYSELIDETDNEEDVNRYLDIIHKETTKINQLIQSMLNLSRLESGKVELHRENIDLEDLITEIIDEYEILLMKKNVKIQMNVIDKNINADKKQLSIVIHNFINNAIKHVAINGRIVIKINKGLYVYNDGEKILADQFNHIWYTFVTYDQQGSGLGLAICKSILELHEFNVGVENKDNGVEFYFYE